MFFFFFPLQNPLTLRPRPALLGNSEFGGSCSAWVCFSHRRVRGVTAADPGPLGPDSADSPNRQFREMARKVDELSASCYPAQLLRPPSACPTRGSRLRSPLQARSEIFQSDFVLYSAFPSQSKGTWQVENSHLSDCVNLPVGISTAYPRCF